MTIEERIEKEIIDLLHMTPVTDFRSPTETIDILEVNPDNIELQSRYECQESIAFRGIVRVKYEATEGHASQIYTINGVAHIESDHVTSLITPLILQRI